MPRGAALSEQSSGESTSHFSSIRIRVNGTGNLRLFVYSLDDLNSKVLVPLPMVEKNRYSPTRIVNFVEQRASFTLQTIEKGERFRINRIVIFSKELYKSYPGS
jgi:hypothetical protein